MSCIPIPDSRFFKWCSTFLFHFCNRACCPFLAGNSALANGYYGTEDERPHLLICAISLPLIIYHKHCRVQNMFTYRRYSAASKLGKTDEGWLFEYHDTSVSQIEWQWIFGYCKRDVTYNFGDDLKPYSQDIPPSHKI